MKFALQSAFIVHFLVIFSTISSGMEIKWENRPIDPNQENAKNSENLSQVNVDHSVNPSQENAEIPLNNFDFHLLSSLLMGIDKNKLISDPTKGSSENIPILGERIEAEYIVAEAKDDLSDVLTSAAINKPINSSLDAKEDSVTYSIDDPTIIHVPLKPRIISMHVPEFHKCVYCNADDGARKYYTHCLKELTYKNLEIMKKCCHKSFDNEFCTRASTGKIDYKAICLDPIKALKTGDCFWMNVQDKEADDIKKYRECKKIVIDRYCPVKSSSDDVDGKFG